MQHRIHRDTFKTDLEFYRSGFPLASLDRVRPAPDRGTNGDHRPMARIAARFIGIAQGTDR